MGLELRTEEWIVKKHSSNLIEISVKEDRYEVAVNSHVIDFGHRMPFEDVGVLYVEGAVPVLKVKVKSSLLAKLKR